MEGKFNKRKGFFCIAVILIIAYFANENVECAEGGGTYIRTAFGGFDCVNISDKD